MTGVLLALLLVPGGRVLAQEARFLGSAACRPCHVEQFAAQSASAHAKSLAPSRDKRISADWAFGAGAQAVTFVSRLDDEFYLEHRLSYYPGSRTYAPTPGHAGVPEPGVRYRTFDPGAAILRCFQCHSTGTLRVDEGNRIEPFEPGVRCEACHGPGSAHAAAPAKGNILQPGRYTAAEMNEFCGSCHRKPAAGGDDTDWTNPWNTRHQPLYLAESACFKESKGKLSCSTCHLIHSGEVRSACASCHVNVKHPAVRITGRTCESCHMPAVKPTQELQFANHWIGVYRGGSALRPRR